MHVAILGFGHQPPAKNLTLAKTAANSLAASGLGVAVGNLVGTFAVALEASAAAAANTLAVIDDSMLDLARPESTETIVVAAELKHATIAQHAVAGLILGGAGGTLRLTDQLLAAGKPMAAVAGTGGAVDDGSLPNDVPIFSDLEAALAHLAAQLETAISMG